MEKMRSKGRRILSISIPDDVSDYLAEKPNKSAFIVELIRKAMEKEREQMEKAEEVEKANEFADWTEEMKAIWRERERAVAKHGSGIEIGMKEYESALEDYWLKMYDEGGHDYRKEDYEWVKSNFPAEDVAYLDKILNLPEEQKIMIASYLHAVKKRNEERRLWEFCGGDPNEIVWRNFTRHQLMIRFKTEERHYTIQGIASELGITYGQAYRYIVPWLRANGISCG